MAGGGERGADSTQAERLFAFACEVPGEGDRCRVRFLEALDGDAGVGRQLKWPRDDNIIGRFVRNA